MREPRVVILGAGPAGVGAAYQLRRRQRAQVIVIEQKQAVGGNAGSFEWSGQRLDYGSHRLHPACDKAILADIRALIGAELLERPRHGRILLRGKWIHFPLKPLDLLLRLDRQFAVATMRDMVANTLAKQNAGAETFASVLRANLGATICDEFYFPYARKIWGCEPDQLSAIQAHRRVSAGSFAKLARKVLSQVPGLKPEGAGRFYYPRQGYGQISEAFAEAARKTGAELMLGWRVTKLEHRDAVNPGWRIVAERNGTHETLESDYVWSTIPISILARAVARPQPPSEVLEATREISYRAMLLVFLQLDTNRFTEYDAHYFPGADMRITRLSEPKNYAASEQPAGSTVLCAELPCSIADEHWAASDEALAALVAEDLARAGIPLPRAPVAVKVQRLSHAYPIYQNGYDRPFGLLDRWVEGLPRLLSYGRQGLFAHDNTHHALYMAYAAVDCLENGEFDGERWRSYRDVFATHVVED